MAVIRSSSISQKVSKNVKLGENIKYYFTFKNTEKKDYDIIPGVTMSSSDNPDNITWYPDFKRTMNAIHRPSIEYYISESVDDDYSDYNSASVSYNDYIKEIESDHNKKMLSILINKLSDKEAKIIRMLYGVDGYTKTNINIIGLEMGLSSQRVSQICKTALKKLKTISNKLSYSFT